MRLPINITIDQDGTRYVSDTGRAQVLIYNADGNFLEAMGKKDEMKPSDVAISSDRLYIADLLNHCVKVYSKAGHKFLFAIPVDDKDPKAQTAFADESGAGPAGRTAAGVRHRRQCRAGL